MLVEPIGADGTGSESALYSRAVEAIEKREESVLVTAIDFPGAPFLAASLFALLALGLFARGARESDSG